MNSSRSALWLGGMIAAFSVVAAGAQASGTRPLGTVQVRPAIAGPHTPSWSGYNAKCRSRGGVIASPCPVTVGSANPVQAVTVTAPGSPAPTISEADNCSANSIASVQGSGSTWAVIAGTSAGSCKAIFTAKNSSGNSVGRAILRITNTGL